MVKLSSDYSCPRLLADHDLSQAIMRVLSQPDPALKAANALQVEGAWRSGSLPAHFTVKPPDKPARPERPQLLPPKDMPKRRKAGSLNGRIALLHALAHIELNAIDLAFDIVARFGSGMPSDFIDDWLKVGTDEAKHFLLLEDRLKAFDCFYGALPAHDSLWQSSELTAHDLAARLAIVPMVLEARGLDVTPLMIERLQKAGDLASAEALQIIYKDEITHVAAGSKWFNSLARQTGQNPASWFHSLVKIYFKGEIQPPFNKEARQTAGLEANFYEPLAFAESLINSL